MDHNSASEQQFSPQVEIQKPKQTNNYQLLKTLAIGFSIVSFYFKFN
ncbi:MAG: hypothetical protein Q7R95_01205 [bacterium]|nr:hypothetical protein [bacterium]